jgi:hypothetical protein
VPSFSDKRDGQESETLIFIIQQDFLSFSFRDGAMMMKVVLIMM